MSEITLQKAMTELAKGLVATMELFSFPPVYLLRKCKHWPNESVSLPLGRINLIRQKMALRLKPTGELEFVFPISLGGYIVLSVERTDLPEALVAILEQASKQRPCPDCHGQGKIPKGDGTEDTKICLTCENTGWVDPPKMSDNDQEQSETQTTA